MQVTHLSLTSFRNYRRLELDIPSGLIVFQGDNAQGKTNLLEAIWVLTTTKSHRATTDRELINHAALTEILPVSRLFAQVQRRDSNFSVEVVLKLEKGSASDSAMVRKRIRLNGVIRRAAALVGQVNAVIFSAQDIDLVSKAPTLRRRFLDIICSQVDPHYLHCLQQYYRVMWQRNRLLRLLREHRARIEQMEFWDRELIENGSYLIEKRHRLVQNLNEIVKGIHLKLSGAVEELEILYMPSVATGESDSLQEIKAEFTSALHAVQGVEIARGMSLRGPHRDDLRAMVNGMDAGIYGSRGQQRTAALSLRLAEAEYLHSQTGEQPVLLLDDIFSELDQKRQEHLLEFVSSSEQALLTTTDPGIPSPSLLSPSACFRVAEGKVEPTCIRGG